MWIFFVISKAIAWTKKVPKIPSNLVFEGGKKKGGAEEGKKEEAKKEEIKFDPITPESLMIGKQFVKANKKFSKVRHCNC